MQPRFGVMPAAIKVMFGLCRPVRLWALAPILFLLAPPIAFANCSGALAGLQSYAGKYRADQDLLAAPAVAARLARLPQDVRQRLQRNLDVSGPARLDACHLVLSGNAPHMGTEQDALLDVDLASGTVTAAIHAGGRIDVYVLADPVPATPRWDALPLALRAWAARADMGFPQQQPRNLAQPASVRLHAPPPNAAPAGAAPRAPGKPLQIDFDKNAIKPTPEQDAAIRRAAGSDISETLPGHAGEPLYALALADLNGDGRDDLLVQYSYAAGACGSAGCSGIIVMATAHGYARKQIGLPNFTLLAVLPTTHGGMHDLQFDRDSPVWQWNGKAYDIPKASLPQSHAPAWETRAAAGRTLALAVPIDSVIKSVSLFCDQGQPVLAILLKLPRPPRPTTLTWVFRGWTVNVAMSPASHDGTLWMSNLSRSDLPVWLAHRGRTRTTQELAQAATESYLRLNGDMQGQVSLKDSAAATRAALARCYRY